MARSASKGIFPRTGILDGHIITHPNGKRYQWNSSKGVWKLKSTMIDDSNFIGPQGIPGPTGATGNTGATGPAVDTSTYWNSSGGWHAASMPGSRIRGMTDNGGEFVLSQDNPSTGRTSTIVDGNYYAGENGGFYSLANSNSYTQRKGFYADTAGNIQFNGPLFVNGSPVSGSGITKSTTAPTGATDGDLWYDTDDDIMYAKVDGNWKELVSGFTADGGNITTSGVYKIHTFTSSGTFTATGNGAVDVLVVAGGGAGGYNNAGGGGAGGLIYKTSHSITNGSYPVIIGGGNTNSQRNLGTAGSNGGRAYTSTYAGGESSVFGLTSKGGGNGGGDDYDGAQGGSGGGGADNPTRYGGTGIQPLQAGDSGVYGYGNRGGNTNNINNSGGCGGGGATAPGVDGAYSIGGGGKQFDISGTNTYYAGGGGGGAHYSTDGKAGGAGGGGNGGSSPQSGSVNTGGGGGGRAQGGPGAYGGSGIVIIRYPI
jgi:hypothetical protein